MAEQLVGETVLATAEQNLFDYFQTLPLIKASWQQAEMPSLTQVLFN